MLRKAVIIVGVTVFTTLMLFAATLRVNGGFENFTALSANSLNSSVLETAGLARESYIYAQPLLRSYRSLYRDIADDSSGEAVGAFNTVKVVGRIEGETDQSITIKAWLDLRTEPLLLHVPQGGGFLEGVQVRDLYGDTLLRHSPDREAANYLFVTASWEGEVPLGIRLVVRARSDLLSVFSAARVASAATYENNKRWAEQVALVPLSAYTMQPPPPVATALKLPHWDDSRAATKHFIPYLNFMLRFLHPQGEEMAALRRFERIGIVAGVPRAPTSFSGAITAGIDQAREELQAIEPELAERNRAPEIEREGIATIGQI